MRTHLRLFTCLFIFKTGVAQQVIDASWQNVFLFSPASAGSQSSTAVSAHHKKGGFDTGNCPELQILTVDAPLPSHRLGIGLTVRNEKAGLSSLLNASGTISYHLKVGKQARLSAGVSGGMIRRSLNFNGLKAQHPEELAAISNLQNAYAPDASAGFNYENKRSFISVAANSLLNLPAIFLPEDKKYQLSYSPLPLYLFAMRQHIFAPGKTWQVSPAMILRSFHGAPVVPDLSLTFTFKSAICLTAGMRQKTAWYSYVAIWLSRSIQFTYCYESNYMNGSLRAPGHEIALCLKLHTNRDRALKTERAFDYERLQEKADIESHRAKVMQTNIDSLRANIQRLESELAELRDRQVDAGHAKTQIQNEKDKKLSYEVVERGQANSEEKGRTHEGGIFEIVYGVYQQADYAKKYQKLLQRSLGMQTRLVAPANQQNHYIYVVSTRDFYERSEAMNALIAEQEKVDAQALKIANGPLWLLHKKESR